MSDAAYTGPSLQALTDAAQGAGIPVAQSVDAPQTLLSSAYWQGKVADFQTVLTSLDQAWQASVQALASPDLLVADATLQADLQAWQDDFNSKKSALRLTGETINGGAALINAAGGDFSNLNLPATLGVAPGAVVPVVWASAFGVAASLIVWACNAMQSLSARLAQSAPAVVGSDAAAGQLAAVRSIADAACFSACGTGFSGVAPLMKWGGLLVAGFLAWRLLQRSKKLASLLDTDED